MREEAPGGHGVTSLQAIPATQSEGQPILRDAGSGEHSTLCGAQVQEGSAELVPHGADSYDSSCLQPESAVLGANELAGPPMPHFLAQYSTEEWSNIVDRELLLARLHGAKNGTYFADMSQEDLLKLLVSSRTRAKALTRRDSGVSSESEGSCAHSAESSSFTSRWFSSSASNKYGESPFAGVSGPLSELRTGSGFGVRWRALVVDDCPQLLAEPRPRCLPLRPSLRGGSMARLREEVAQAIPRSTVRFNAAIRRGYLLKLGIIAPPTRAPPPAAPERALEEEGEAAGRGGPHSPVAGGPDPDAPRTCDADFDHTEMAYALGETLRVAESRRMDELSRAMLLKRCASGGNVGGMSPTASRRASRRRESSESRSTESPSPGASPSPSEPSESPLHACPSPRGASLKAVPSPPSPTSLLSLVRSTSMEAFGLVRSSSHETLAKTASSPADSSPADQEQLLYGGWCM